MAYSLTLNGDQHCALLYAIELALDDQEYYLKMGNFSTDYADEWPEVAANKAQQFENLAPVCQQLDAPSMTESCLKLAKDFREAA